MRKLVTIVQTVGEDDSDSEISNRKELSAAQPQPKKIRNGILAAKNAKDAEKESGFVGAGLKPALLDLAHREIRARRANYHG
jgi:hypothetical protein